MNHIAVQWIGITSFMMINSSRQMHERGLPLKTELQNMHKLAIADYTEHLALIELEYDVRVNGKTINDDQKKPYSDEIVEQVKQFSEKPPLSKNYIDAAKTAHEWLKKNFKREGVTLENKSERICILRIVLGSLNPSSEPRMSSSSETSTSTSIYTPTGSEEPGEEELIIGWISKHNKDRRNEVLESHGNKIPIEKSQDTTLPQPSVGKGTAAKNESAKISSTYKGKTLRKNPSTDQDKSQNELTIHSKRSDGPSATRSKITSSHKKKKGKKKQNWRH